MSERRENLLVIAFVSGQLNVPARIMIVSCHTVKLELGWSLPPPFDCFLHKKENMSGEQTRKVLFTR